MGWASQHNLLARAVNHAVGGVTVTCGAVTTQGILEKNAELIVNGQVISVEYALHNVPTEQFGSLLYGSGITVDNENYLVRDNLIVGDGMFCVLSLEKIAEDSGIFADPVLDGGSSVKSDLRYKLRRDTAANWALSNPVLYDGEPGIETDTRRTKYGDGVTPWNALKYEDNASVYTHNQPSASNTWTMSHNLGFKPSVELFNVGSQEIDGEVVHISDNVCIAYFTTPIAGFARLN